MGHFFLAGANIALFFYPTKYFSSFLLPWKICTLYAG